jgi:hypothetical protein
MARLVTADAESQNKATEGITATLGTGATFDTTTPLFGAASFLYNPGAALATDDFGFTGALGRGIYARAYVRINTMVSGDWYMFDLSDATGGTSIYSAALVHSTGAVDLEVSGAGVLGSMAAGSLTTGVYRFEMFAKWGTGAVDEAELRIFTEHSTVPHRRLGPFTGQAIAEVAVAKLRLGNDNAAAGSVEFDEIAINDNTGAVDNSWVGPLPRYVYDYSRFPRQRPA